MYDTRLKEVKCVRGLELSFYKVTGSGHLHLITGFPQGHPASSVAFSQGQGRFAVLDFKCVLLSHGVLTATLPPHMHTHPRIRQVLPRTGRLSCPGIATAGLFTHQEESENPVKERLCLSASQAVTSRCRQQTRQGHQGPILFTLPSYCSVVQCNLF